MSKDKLQELYIVQGLSAHKIASKFGCAHSTVIRRLRKYDIEIRPRGAYFKDYEEVTD